jgi:xylose isomerase
MGFLQQYGLGGEFALNIECNHATLAGHSCDHELQVGGQLVTPQRASLDMRASHCLHQPHSFCVHL